MFRSRFFLCLGLVFLGGFLLMGWFGLLWWAAPCEFVSFVCFYCSCQFWDFSFLVGFLWAFLLCLFWASVFRVFCGLVWFVSQVFWSLFECLSLSVN